MSAWIYVFHTPIGKENQVVDFLSNVGCDGLLVSSLHPLSIIEKHVALKKLIQEDKFVGSCSRIIV